MSRTIEQVEKEYLETSAIISKKLRLLREKEDSEKNLLPKSGNTKAIDELMELEEKQKNLFQELCGLYYAKWQSA